MAKAERGVVKAPNQDLQGLAATRSPTPPAGKPVVHGPNSRFVAGDPGGSADLVRRKSPVVPPSLRFNVKQARMPQPPAATEPGRGEIPVDPNFATQSPHAHVPSLIDDMKPR